VYALKRDFPDLDFSLNGGVESCHGAAAALAHGADGPGGARLAGVMIGRAAYHYPWACLADADVAVFGAEANAAASRREVGGFSTAKAPWWLYKGRVSSLVSRRAGVCIHHAERCRRAL
jgi:tRNA-dihydrouridine synthase